MTISYFLSTWEVRASGLDIYMLDLTFWLMISGEKKEVLSLYF